MWEAARRHTHPSKAQRGNHRPSSFRLRTRQDHRHARPLDRRYEYLPTCIDSSPPHLRSMRGASRVRLESRVHFCVFDARVTHDWRVRASHSSRDGCKPLLQVPPGGGSASAQRERDLTARPRSRSTAREPDRERLACLTHATLRAHARNTQSIERASIRSALAVSRLRPERSRPH